MPPLIEPVWPVVRPCQSYALLLGRTACDNRCVPERRIGLPQPWQHTASMETAQNNGREEQLAVARLPDVTCPI